MKVHNESLHDEPGPGLEPEPGSKSRIQPAYAVCGAKAESEPESVFAWPASPPTPEQIARFNAERERVNRELKSKLDELRILVENAKRERAKEAELNLGAGI